MPGDAIWEVDEIMPKIPPCDELLPCRVCGATCSVQVFDGENVTATLWVCSEHQKLGGACLSTVAYLSAEAWNTRTPPPGSGREAGLETENCRAIVSIARAIYERRPFVMGSTETLTGVSIGKAFDWDGAPAYYQSEMLDLARAAFAAIRALKSTPPAPQDSLQNQGNSAMEGGPE